MERAFGSEMFDRAPSTIKKIQTSHPLMSSLQTATLTNLTDEMINLLKAVSNLESKESKNGHEIVADVTNVLRFLINYPELIGVATEALWRFLPEYTDDLRLWTSSIFTIAALGDRSPILSNIFESSPELGERITGLYWKASELFPSEKHSRVSRELASMLPVENVRELVMELGDPKKYAKFYTLDILSDDEMKRNVIDDQKRRLEPFGISSGAMDFFRKQSEDEWDWRLEQAERRLAEPTTTPENF